MLRRHRHGQPPEDPRPPPRHDRPERPGAAGGTPAELRRPRRDGGRPERPDVRAVPLGGWPTPARCDALGTLLGRLHGALDDVCAPLDPPAGYRSADPLDSAELARELRRRAREHRPYGDLDALVEQRLGERLELLAEHAHRRPDPLDAPPTGWTHGDFHGLNLLYDEGPDGERVAAVLDWDKLGPQPRAEEAVRAATLLFNDRTTGTLDLVRVRRYSQAYRASGAATAEHLAAAVHRVWWERLNDFWMLQWRYQRADHRADPLFPASAGQLAWWCQEYEQVLDAFAN